MIDIRLTYEEHCREITTLEKKKMKLSLSLSNILRMLLYANVAELPTCAKRDLLKEREKER